MSDPAETEVADARKRLADTLRRQRVLVLLFLVLVAAMISGGYAVYRLEVNALIEARHGDLEAVGSLTSRHIVQWREERLGDARLTVESPYTRRAVAEWLVDSGGEELVADLRQRLRLLCEIYHYGEALLLSPSGEILISAAGALDPLSSAAMSCLDLAAESGEPEISDLYRGRDGRVSIDVVAPIAGDGGSPIAMILLRSDAEQFLYPLVEAWPTPSRTAETMLVTRDGDSVLYLNGLRNRPEAGLMLRIPIERSCLPGARALQGVEGIVVGKDYRGEEVIADLRRVPGSNWYLVSKWDVAEIVDDARRHLGFLSAIVFLMLVLTAIAFVLAHRHKQASLFQDLLLSEQALQESEELYRQLMDAAPAGIAVHSEGKAVLINAAGLEILRADSEDQVLGRPISDFIDPDRLGPALERVERMLAGERGLYPVDEVFRRIDGTPVDVEIMGSALTYNGKPAVQLIATDITERKKAQAERERLVTAIEQTAEAIMITDSEGAIQYVNPMFTRQSGYSREETIGPNPRMLMSETQEHVFFAEMWDTISRGDVWQGQVENKRKDGSLYTVEETVAPVRDPSGKITNYVSTMRDITREIELEQQCRQAQKMESVGRLAGGVAHDFNNMLSVILGSVELAQLDQVLANLCVNARDAMRGGGRIVIETEKVRIDAEYCENHADFVPGDFLMLSVSDNGCGMKKDVMERIFEPFFTMKPPGEGTGLGLSTVYGIIKQNSGFIHVYSEPGEGTTFKLYVPVYAGVGDGGDISDPVAVPRGTGQVILVVEDEEPILRLTERMLTQLGYTVLSASSPHGGIQLARDSSIPIDLLLTDVIMPTMNGRMMEDELRAFCPGLKSLFMSGYTADVIAHRGVLNAGVHFMPKPFTIQTLATNVNRALSKPT